MDIEDIVTTAPSNTHLIARLIAADLAKSPPFDYSDPVALRRTIQGLARKYKCR
jgi:hypothetical protein